jgi:ubiquinone/menaquinone biosynthesis C-methylase UbiE
MTSKTSKMDETHSVDWSAWLQRWDVQQSGYLPEREAHFDAMFDVLAVLLPDAFIAVDLACGPGSISQRLLTRFSQARCIAVDLDPVLLTMGQKVLGTVEDRLQWIEADPTTPEWIAQLGIDQVNAVLSTTALHWLPTADLIRVYRQLGQIVRPGGVVLNGDHIAFEATLASFQRVVDYVKARQEEEVFMRRGVEDWAKWWQAAEAEPGLQVLVAKRKRRLAWRQQADTYRPSFALHEAALRDAGFQQVGVIWQRQDNRVLMAVR